MIKAKKIRVCILGIDGSGKTSVALELLRLLQAENINCAYIHHEFTLLNLLPKILKINLQNCASYVSLSRNRLELNDDKNKLNIVNMIVACVFALGVVLNSLLGIIFEERAHRDKKVIIYDRYFYDHLIPYYYLIPHWLKILCLRIIPQPDLILYLEVDPQIAKERKKEDDLNFYILQQERISYFVNNYYLKKIYCIDANQQVNQVVDRIIKIITSEVGII